MILTDNEIHDMPGYKENREMFRFARAIESALLQKLAAGVSVEPVGYIDEMDTPRLSNDQRKIKLICCGGGIQLFTISQLQTAVAAARVQENERCAKVCEAPHHYFNDCKTNSECATAIRALIGGPSHG